MLEFCVYKQTIKRMDKDTIVAGSVDYLEAEVHFSNDWAGYTKTIVFTSATSTIPIVLDANNKVTADDSLNLTAGSWVVSVNGVNGDKKISTCITSFSVSSNIASS